MNDTTETFEFEDRSYTRPELSRDEQLTFVDTFRDAQTQSANKIAQDTYNLGSPLPSNQGGLGGSEQVWEAQYRTPYVNQTVANLQAAAQQAALNQALNNLQNMWANRYNQAYRRARAKAATTTTPKNPSNNDGDKKLPIDTNEGGFSLDDLQIVEIATPGQAGALWYDTTTPTPAQATNEAN